MRTRSRILAWMAYVLVAGWAAYAWSAATSPTPPVVDGEDAKAWFQRVRPSCTQDEVQARLAEAPAPTGLEGVGYAAACLTLAGEVEAARARIRSLQGSDRWMAAGIVFEQIHPRVDAGEEMELAPGMELVVDFWSNHPQALYHAGSARYKRGHDQEARGYLTRFLEHHRMDDAWSRDARSMLEAISQREGG